MATPRAAWFVPERAAELELRLEPALDRSVLCHVVGVVLDLLAIADDPVVPDDQELEWSERRQRLIDRLTVVEELHIDARFRRDHEGPISLVSPV